MKRSPKIGLLPLYLALYDEAMPEVRNAFPPLLAGIVKAFAGHGVEVVEAPVSRIASEFAYAISLFEKVDVDLIVTVHLAYSPSLEAVDALANSTKQILMLDTTMDFDFGRHVDPARLMYNHGVHGVQDLANVLLRRGKAIEIVAGHFERSNVLGRAADHARAALAARQFRNTKALRIGETFKGMGDFAVADEVLGSKLGIRVTQSGLEPIAAALGAVTDADVEQEVASDNRRFDVTVPHDVHCRSVRVGLALRRVLDEGGYNALSMNFLAFNSRDGAVNTVPFLEASKAMARGIGYAGEGDVLTASLVGALQSSFGRTTFTEIFCPDWQGDSLFISHMGEVNPETAAGKPLVFEKDFPWTPALNPAVLACATAPGPCVLVNIAPGPQDTFSIIAAPMTSLGDGTHSGMPETIRGWIRPACGVANFLEQYSRLGGTHHKALVMGEKLEAVQAFARYAGLPIHTIGE